MSERYFVVTEQHELFKDFVAQKENEQKVREVFKAWKARFYVEADTYLPTAKRISIEATANDLQKFKDQFMSGWYDGLKEFKLKSEMNLTWVSMLKSEQLSVLHRPRVIFYLPHGCKNSWVMNLINGVLYLYYKTDADFETPDGMIEIKGSEYHKVIEDYEESLKGGS